MTDQTTKEQIDGGEIQTEEIVPKVTEGDITPENIPGGEELPPQGEDYKKKFGESTRENQRILSENARLTNEKTELEAKLGKTLSNETPSESDLQNLYPDWDLMSPTERTLLKRQVSLERSVGKLNIALGETTKEVHFDREFDKIAGQYNSLEGKKQEFKFYASQNPGANLEVLAKSFLFEEAKTIGALEEKAKVRKGLESGSGGQKTAPKQGLTDEEQAEIRKTDPKRYVKLIQEGKI